MKKYLSAPGLLEIIRQKFSAIREESNSKKKRSKIALVDCLMSGFAIFSLKYASLLEFDAARTDEEANYNLKSLYKITQVPSDTYMREIG